MRGLRLVEVMRFPLLSVLSPLSTLLVAEACAASAPVSRHASIPLPSSCAAVGRAGVAVYVAPGGTRVGPGTRDAPWDLATALACAAAGDTVWLRGGVYSGSFATMLRGT